MTAMGGGIEEGTRTAARIGGPDAAFERLFAEHYDALLAFATRRVEGTAAVDDVLAETFAVAWRRLDSIPEPPRPWLYGVARKVIANQARGERRTLRLSSRLAAEPQRDAGGDPGVEVPRRLAVADAFASLSAADREILRLVAWEGLDATEGAVAFGCTKTAFRVRLHRARRRLESALAATTTPARPNEEKDR